MGPSDAMDGDNKWTERRGGERGGKSEGLEVFDGAINNHSIAELGTDEMMEKLL